jgi:hypothetical protein
MKHKDFLVKSELRMRYSHSRLGVSDAFDRAIRAAMAGDSGQGGIAIDTSGLKP